MKLRTRAFLLLALLIIPLIIIHKDFLWITKIIIILMLLIVIYIIYSLIRKNDKLKTVLKNYEENYHLLIESTLEAIIIVDRYKNVIIYNQKFLKIWELSENLTDTSNNVNQFNLIPDKVKDSQKYTNYVNELLNDMEKTSVKEFDLKNGKVIEIHGQPYMIGNKEIGKLFTYMNMTSRKKTKEKLNKQTTFFDEIFDSIEEGIQIVDENEIIRVSNPATAKIFEEDLDKIIGKSILEYLDDDGKKIVLSQTNKRKKRKSTIYGLSIITAKGNHKQLQLSVSPKFDKNGKYRGAFVALTDISEQKRIEDRLRNLATTDYLTGIYNRRHYVYLTKKEIKRTKRYNHQLSMIMIDIDRFKLINDSYGHSIGDNVLKRLCYACKTQLRDSDIFGRIGGEEFAITMLECDLSNALVVAERIRKIIEDLYVKVNGSGLSFTISIGVAEFSKEEDNFYSLLKKTDDALYTAKEKGRNRVEEYKQENVYFL